MSSAHAGTRAVGPGGARPILSRILVGVDGTEAAFEACRQVARLAEADTTVDAVAVVHLGPDVAAALEAGHVTDVLEREAEAALEQAVAILGPRARARRVDGLAAPALLEELGRAGTTLLALGSHGHRRTTEILLGGVAGELLHEAPCSVLIARPAPAATFPRALVVGHDGSAQADGALAVANQLAARFGSPLRVITAVAGKGVDLAHVHLRMPFGESVDDHPVQALVEAAREADLLVVGSRGLHGLRALGSVSERVAHQATCSVLVVRSTRGSPARGERLR
jgi:nucleotide-binding universal stress UspA family protein